MTPSVQERRRSQVRTRAVPKALEPIRWLLLLVALVASPRASLPVVTMQSVGHGDSYVVAFDGRVIVVDVGPPGNVNGLASILPAYTHFDRIVITHVHCDHCGGFVPAGRWARQHDVRLTTDLLVSNHGKHDIDLVIQECNVSALLSQLRRQHPVKIGDVSLDDVALTDNHMEVRGIPPMKSHGRANENQTGLILKVTEIRDGARRATLFLGDIERSAQSALFSRSDAIEILRDVKAVTLPHHGHQRTLSPRFFDEVKRLAGDDVKILHSDADPLTEEVSRWNSRANLKIISTADLGPNDDRVIVDLFPEKSYYEVGPRAMTLLDVVRDSYSEFMSQHHVSVGEVADVVGRFCGRSPHVPLSAREVITLPGNEELMTQIAERQRRVSEYAPPELRGFIEDELRRKARLREDHRPGDPARKPAKPENPGLGERKDPAKR